MRDFIQHTPYNVPFFLLEPVYKKIKGVEVKTFKKNDEPFYCSFRTFGGTEKVVNDVLVLEDTAIIETWYDPSITANCNIEIDGEQYEIMGTPENINKRNQTLVFKVKAVKGGA